MDGRVSTYTAVVCHGMRDGATTRCAGATHATVRCVRERKRNDSAGGQRSASGIPRFTIYKATRRLRFLDRR